MNTAKQWSNHLAVPFILPGAVEGLCAGSAGVDDGDGGFTGFLFRLPLLALPGGLVGVSLLDGDFGNETKGILR